MCRFDGENPRARIREVDGEFAGQSNRDCKFDVLIRIQPNKLDGMVFLHDGLGWLGVNGGRFIPPTSGLEIYHATIT